MATYVKDAFKLLRLPQKYSAYSNIMKLSIGGILLGTVVLGQQMYFQHDHYYSQMKGKSQLYRERMKKLPANIDPWTEKPYLNQPKTE